MSELCLEVAFSAEDEGDGGWATWSVAGHERGSVGRLGGEGAGIRWEL